ncbi:hypothetical protein BGW38_000292 [Lunasporangiospora selenospora]|uniref:Swiss Army Knife 2H phosphoesterase domain-containing protein n=1 Tax=Lunasporangiospora selenospora TaxID=979761 RepID=A0A9P6FX91_9FUNG|nr:hypothetical protein BGW38_000292 [Lunasporangiospora selenospora]
MKIAATLLATLALAASSVLAANTNTNKNNNNKPIRINKKVLQTSKVPFIPHSGTTLFSNWVGLNVDFKYVKPIFNLANTTASIGNGTLVSRGEAHITVILPTEFDTILQPAGVTIKEINDLASRKNRLQKSKFAIECLGRVQVVTKNDGVFQQSLQLIVKRSRDLIKFREDVFKIYVKKGGNPALFDPENFMPHITIGFRGRDIHAEDGVFKRKNACIRRIASV